MDRREAVLRELNLYPQWVRRGEPVSAVAEHVSEPEALPAVRPEPAEGRECPPVVSVHASTSAFSPVLVEGSARTEKNILPAALQRSQLDNLGWPELKQRVHDCTDCKLRAGCTQTVFGVGGEKAEWLFVGEAPGADEDALGEPFVGQAGKLLDSMLLAIKLKRGKNVFITNVVKCRPPDNRNPASDEIAQCLPYLQRQIELIKPKLIVALGKVASNSLLGKDKTLASLRGKLHDYNGTPLIVTYHPAYLLRSPTEKAKAWQDLLLAMRSMGETV